MSPVITRFGAGARHSKRLRWLAAMTGVVLIVGLAHPLWLPWLHAFLDISEPPQQVDFIVMLSGGSERALEAARLYRAGYAPRVVISGCSSSLERDHAVVLEAGVPPEAITLVTHAQSTWEEAHLVLALLRAEGARSALIVTHGYHTRRARDTYAHVQDDDYPIDLIFVPVPAAISADSWYRSANGRFAVLSEYAKMGYYLLNYGVTPW